MLRNHLKLAGLTFALLLLASSSRADQPTANLLVEGWHHRVWSLYPVEKVRPDEVLPAKPQAETIQLTAARGEYEPFLLVLRGDVPLRAVKVEPAVLAGPDGAQLKADCFEVRRVAYITIDEPSGTRIKNVMPFTTSAGAHPDVLMRGDGELRPGRNLQFWVTLHIPHEAKPGRYAGTVKVNFRREGWMPDKAASSHAVPISVVVRNFALPERSPLLNTAFFDPRTLPRAAREPAVLQALCRDWAAHRQMPLPLLPSPVIKLDRAGQLTVDSAAWEKQAQFYFDELKASHLFLPVRTVNSEFPLVEGFYFLWHFPMVCKQSWFGARVMTEDRQLTPEFKARFGAYLRHMHGVLARRGWLDRVFVPTVDEPYTYHQSGTDRVLDTTANNYEAIRNLAGFIHKTAPGLKTYCTGDPVPGLTGAIDHWCLRNLQFATAARERAAQHGELITFCDNYRSFVDFPLVAPRTLGWVAWKIGARGWLTYETLGSFATAWEGPAFVYPQFNGGTVWGMGQYFYPDPNGPGLLPSVRWEMMREGAEDYEYLWLLRQRLAALTPDQRDAATAQQAQQLLMTAANAVVGGSGDAETTSSAAAPNTQSNLVPHQLREQIAALLEQLGAP